ncbi:MAG: PAN domain-containing protein [Pyrinomonadaceae bacterium]
MKTCPSCNRKYEDATMMFCLQDGTRLVSDVKNDQATWHLPQSPVTEPARAVPVPATTASPQATITARPEQFQAKPQFAASQTNPEDRSRRSPLPWILAIIFVLGASGVLIAWIVTRSRAPEGSLSNVATPSPRTEIASSAVSPEVIDSPQPSETRSATNQPAKNDKLQKPTPAPSPPRARPAFSLMNNTSLNGSRITYYPRASMGQCQSDCAANGNCKGFAWIRPGAYNPGDSAMCYLLSAVTGKVSHPCCIAGVRN